MNIPVKNIYELREQLQEDLRCYLDDLPSSTFTDQIIDGVCDIIVNRFAEILILEPKEDKS